RARRSTRTQATRLIRPKKLWMHPRSRLTPPGSSKTARPPRHPFATDRRTRDRRTPGPMPREQSRATKAEDALAGSPPAAETHVRPRASSWAPSPLRRDAVNVYGEARAADQEEAATKRARAQDPNDRLSP